MKRILILALILSSVQVRGQTSIFKPYQPLSHVVPQKLLPADSSIEVVYIDEFKDSHSGKGVASFLNGKFVDSSVWSTLPRSFIDNVYVVDKTIDIDQVKYFRQYYFTTKSTYTPKLLTLNGLKEKYVSLENMVNILKRKPVVFVKIVEENYSII